VVLRRDRRACRSGLSGYAALAPGFVVFVNLLLRPIVSFINRQPLICSEVETGYLIALSCRAEGEAHIRALLLQGLERASALSRSWA
jgi:putative Mg2+ transporter-C (MgtC) family protein